MFTLLFAVSEIAGEDQEGGHDEQNHDEGAIAKLEPDDEVLCPGVL